MDDGADVTAAAASADGLPILMTVLLVVATDWWCKESTTMCFAQRNR